MAFLVGEVHTRPGLQNLFAVFAGNPSVNYLKTFTDLQLNNRALILDALGTLHQEFPQNTLTTVSTAIVPGSYGESTTFDGREWLGLSDGKFGLDIPRQWDGTNFDRVSQVGPGAPPNASDENVSQATTTESQPAAVNIAASPNGLSINGYVVTVTTSAPHLLAPGQNVVIAGASFVGLGFNIINNGSNGVPATWPVITVPSATTFTIVVGFFFISLGGNGTVSSCLATYNFAAAHGLVAGQLIIASGIAPGGYNAGPQDIFSVPSSTSFTLNLTVSGLGPGGVGVATNSGNVVAGVHQVCVIFVTRQGYLTRPSPPSTWTAQGGRRAVLANIPIGPANIVARIVAFTSSGGATFYYIGANPATSSPSMTINDNTTTSTTFDFTDAVLLNGTQVDAPANNLFNLVELGEVSGFIDYASRLFAWGERNKIQDFLNPTFDGGWNLAGGAGASDIPLGWNQGVPGTVLAQAGGSRVAGPSPNVVWGDAYKVTGDGATAQLGMISQSMTDALGVPIIGINTAYSVRAKIIKSVGSTLAFAVVDIFSPSAGVLGGTTVSVGSGSAGFTEFIGTLVTAQATLPADAVLRYYVGGTPLLGEYIIVDNIEIFPTLEPYNNSLVRGSYVDDLESYDDQTGIQQYGFSDGTRVTSAFKLRDKLYFVKERSLWTTQDDGTNEPTKWTVDKVSDVGTPSVQGVGIGEDWVVIAGRAGLYFFDTREPDKLSQEIQKPILTPLNTILPGWDTINWQFGHRLWCKVDKLRRRIMVGAPTGEHNFPNTVFVLDYRGLDTGSELMNDTSVHISGYTGKILQVGNARKWTRWNMRINSCDLIERQDGTAHTWMGNGSGTGKVYDLLEVQDFANPAQFSDDGVLINSYYDTYYFIRPDQEDMLQMGSHRKLFYYFTTYIEGQGIPTYSAIPPGNAPAVPIPQSGNAAPALRTSNGAFGIAITLVTRNGTVITVTTATPHGLTTSDNVVLSGVTDATYNGLYGGVQIVNPSVFTVPSTILGGNSAGGIMLPFTRDTEIPVNVLTERMKLRIQTNAVGSWFSLRNLCLSMRADPWALVRGGPS